MSEFNIRDFPFKFKCDNCCDGFGETNEPSEEDCSGCPDYPVWAWWKKAKGVIEAYQWAAILAEKAGAVKIHWEEDPPLFTANFGFVDPEQNQKVLELFEFKEALQEIISKGVVDVNVGLEKEGAVVSITSGFMPHEAASKLMRIVQGDFDE